LNVEADKLATSAILNHLKKDRALEVIMNPFCKAYLRNGKNIITNSETVTLQTKWTSKNIKGYFKGRFEYKLGQIEDIDWDAVARARKQMSIEELNFATKLLTGWVTTGKRKALYGDLVVGCHRCGAKNLMTISYNATANKQLRSRQWPNSANTPILSRQSQRWLTL
jgi:hypothetical protein